MRAGNPLAACASILGSRVVLATNDTLAGYVALHLSPDFLYLTQPDGTVRAFEPQAVQAFAVQGEVTISRQGTPQPTRRADSTVVRLFRTVLLPPEGPGQRPQAAFYEQICAGPVLLLRRPSFMLKTLPVANSATPPDALSRANMSGNRGPAMATAAAYPARFQTVNETRDAFFLAWPTGEIRALGSVKKDILAAFPDHVEQLKKYAQSRHMGFSTAQELSELVTYANSLATR